MQCRSVQDPCWTSVQDECKIIARRVTVTGIGQLDKTRRDLAGGWLVDAALQRNFFTYASRWSDLKRFDPYEQPIKSEPHSYISYTCVALRLRHERLFVHTGQKSLYPHFRFCPLFSLSKDPEWHFATLGVLLPAWLATAVATRNSSLSVMSFEISNTRTVSFKILNTRTVAIYTIMHCYILENTTEQSNLDIFCFQQIHLVLKK